MDLFEYAKNIKNINIEQVLNECISNVRSELSYLTEDRTCKVFSNYLGAELKEKGISYRLINTLDLGGSYEHEFILVSDIDNYYLVDLTFSQFKVSNLYFENLAVDGYIKVDDNTFNEYLKLLGISQFFKLDEVYYLNISKNVL